MRMIPKVRDKFVCFLHRLDYLIRHKRGEKDLTINLIGLLIVFLPAYFSGRKLRRMLPKGKEFIGLVGSVGILIIFLLTKDIWFLTNKNSLFNALGYGITYGLAFGLASRE